MAFSFKYYDNTKSKVILYFVIQGFRELALLQHQQMAQRMAVEAQKRIQEQQGLQQQVNWITIIHGSEKL